MTNILGKDVTVSIVVNTSPQDIEKIGCGTEASLTTTMNIAPKSTAGSGKFQEFTGISLGWNVTVNGFATVNRNMDIRTLRAMQFSLQPVIISFLEANPVADIYYAGYAYILSITATGNFNNAETYSINFGGTGELLMDAVAVYGTYPMSVAATLAGLNTLLISWTDVPYPVPDSYTVRITDLDLNTTTLYNNATSGDTYPIDQAHHYAIAVQSDYGALGKSLFSPDIFYFL